MTIAHLFTINLFKFNRFLFSFIFRQNKCLLKWINLCIFRSDLDFSAFSSENSMLSTSVIYLCEATYRYFFINLQFRLIILNYLWYSTFATIRKLVSLDSHFIR